MDGDGGLLRTLIFVDGKGDNWVSSPNPRVVTVCFSFSGLLCLNEDQEINATLIHPPPLSEAPSLFRYGHWNFLECFNGRSTDFGI